MKYFRFLIFVPLAFLYSSAFGECSDKHVRKDTQSPPPITDGKQL